MKPKELLGLGMDPKKAPLGEIWAQRQKEIWRSPQLTDEWNCIVLAQQEERKREAKRESRREKWRNFMAKVRQFPIPDEEVRCIARKGLQFCGAMALLYGVIDLWCTYFPAR